jgi:hypothetical protein
VDAIRPATALEYAKPARIGSAQRLSDAFGLGANSPESAAPTRGTDPDAP